MCDLKERNVSFPFVVIFSAFWNVGVMTEAVAARLDYGVTYRMKVLCEGGGEEKRPKSCGCFPSL